MDEGDDNNSFNHRPQEIISLLPAATIYVAKNGKSTFWSSPLVTPNVKSISMYSGWEDIFFKELNFMV